MLDARPGIKRAFIADSLPNGGGLVTLAIRGVGSCELVIPEGQYDPLEVKKLFDELVDKPSDSLLGKRRGIH
jgi:hypothetical protein